MSYRADIALTCIYEVSKLLSAPMRLETRLAGVMGVLSSFLDMQNGLIALLRSDGSPEMVVGAGWMEARAQVYFERLPERAIGQIVTTGMPLVVGNVAFDPLFQDWAGPGKVDGADNPDAVCSFIGVPVKDKDRVIGTLTIDRQWNGRSQIRFDEDVRFLNMIAGLVGQAVRLQEVVARDRERLMAEQARLEKALQSSTHQDAEFKGGGIVGKSPALKVALDKIAIVARSHTAVLLRGESGTGKELFARAIHDLSPRKDGPFIKLNCAALPESVLESELFGHEKGAFTGAVNQRRGRFEMADGGTLFLDEIGEISPSFQAKLLRVLQEGEFERVGGSRTLKADFRLVAATNRNLEEAVARGEFRADLYYRISVVPVALPPLRDRTGDVPLLAGEFLRRFNKENGTSLSLDASAVHILNGCYFPGNVRELENCIRRTATFSKGSAVTQGDFACQNDVCLSAVLWNGSVSNGSLGVSPSVGAYAPPPAMGARPGNGGGGSSNGASGPGVGNAVYPPPQSRTAFTLPGALPSAMPAAVCPPQDGGEGGFPASCPSAADCPVLGGDVRSEKDRLMEALETAGWVQAKAARILGLTPRQIGYALKKHNIELKKF